LAGGGDGEAEGTLITNWTEERRGGGECPPDKDEKRKEQKKIGDAKTGRPRETVDIKGEKEEGGNQLPYMVRGFRVVTIDHLGKFISSHIKKPRKSLWASYVIGFATGF